MSSCVHCGAELDDFAPCACALAPRPKSKASTYSMRHLVTRKLERQRADKAQKEPTS